MIKNYLFAFAFALISFSGYSQVTDLVEPKSWSNNFSDDEIELVSMPFEDLAKFMEEDLRKTQESMAKPYRFGAKLQTNVTRQSHGESIILENDDVIWRVGFESVGAKTLNFIIRDYNLVEGAELYIYNADRSMKMGPYTSSENNDINEITTWPIDGDKVYLEFYEPSEVAGQSTFTIAELVHGYRSIPANNAYSKALNDSGSCNIDADCPLGDNFDLQKRSVVMLVAGGNGFCTGTLVNNTSEDGTPYILTANHCGAGFGQEAPVNATASWAFRFNWISPNPSCATFTPSTNGPFLQTLNGAIVRASDGDSDMLLLEATAANAIPSDWDVVFAGWSRSTTVPAFTTGIHHPSGDIMKICRDDDPSLRVNVSFNGFTNRVWFIDDGANGGWEQGVTEPGSSGSQLLDASGLLIGVLSGGSAACVGTNDNNGFDFYGRLDRGWSDVGSFLDPISTGTITTDHLENLSLSVDDFNQTGFFQIYPNPSNGIIYFTSKLQSNEKLHYALTDVQGKLVLKSTMDLRYGDQNEIQLEGITPGIYFLSFESENIREVKKIIIN
ncbi:T9SS type A sorting domain-containing protein [Winogradskyella sp.]|uniref:T9SS type A sorting domain-containing protein n=1 Tax=Winogradskyella sp. TaxID=1883156 RepID=UPI0026104BE2|nr:T9SS type A sorting domain-containing protein [Winogradskyella sp.]